jgi:hypothetical protein
MVGIGIKSHEENKMIIKEQDKDFKDVKIAKVRRIEGEDPGYELTFEDGWSLWVDDYRGIPVVGSIARLYGNGSTRGVDIDGVEVFYRTPEGNKKYHQEMLYGQDAREMLERWDAGQNVWTIEMGGLGPGYEQAIQVLMMEIIRDEIDNELPDQDGWPVWADKTISRVDARIGGFSGAQVYAAKSLAFQFLKVGPIGIMTEEDLKDSHKIQINKDFPSL